MRRHRPADAQRGGLNGKRGHMQQQPYGFSLARLSYLPPLTSAFSPRGARPEIIGELRVRLRGTCVDPPFSEIFWDSRMQQARLWRSMRPSLVVPSCCVSLTWNSKV